MSHENVDMVRRAVEAFNRRDLAELAVLSDADLEFVSVLTAVDTEEATYRGNQAWASYFADIDRVWTEWQIEDLRVFDVGDDRIAAVFRIVGKGRQSGVPVERMVGITYGIRQGKLWRMRSYPEPSEALEAVGLRGG
ncbi:MAG: hypothetical protein QOK31_1525 [Solirubrobacteraceae bacterium]|jgi:ketosteroid isomerase-like protein|nr:hypothetical protein [Solirubrobacteraceae bacterium]